MGASGLGPTVLAVTWSEFAAGTVLMALRIYTNGFILRRWNPTTLSAASLIPLIVTASLSALSRFPEQKGRAWIVGNLELDSMGAFRGAHPILGVSVRVIPWAGSCAERSLGLGDIGINVNPLRSDARLADLSPRMSLQP